MADNPNGATSDDSSNQDEQEPQFVASRPGRMVSLQGLVDRIIEEFNLEHGEGESEALSQSTTDIERRKLVRDIASYIFGVESVQLSPHEQAQIMKKANDEIFGYGPLQVLLEDETVTTISLDGVAKVGVRYGVAQDLQVLDPIFEDTPHMRRTIHRLLRHAQAELTDENPIIETGLTVGERRISISVAAPPLVPEMAVDIRVHPATLPTLDDWVTRGILNPQSHALLQAIATSEHGFIIVGDTESGKTTLLSMLLQQLPNKANLITVERAGELVLPENARRYVTQWAYNDRDNITFGQQIINALDQTPTTIALDEIRADEPATIAPLLAKDDVPRQIWSFRGTSEAKRLKSALGMLARMADGTQSENLVLELYRRLPFMIIIKRRKGKLQVREIAEWQFPQETTTHDDIIYADYIPLMEMDWEDCQITGRKPQNDLNLPDDFLQKPQ